MVYNLCFIAGNVKCDTSKIEGPVMRTLTEVVVVLHRGMYFFLSSYAQVVNKCHFFYTASYIPIMAWRAYNWCSCLLLLTLV